MSTNTLPRHRRLTQVDGISLADCESLLERHGCPGCNPETYAAHDARHRSDRQAVTR